MKIVDKQSSVLSWIIKDFQGLRVLSAVWASGDLRTDDAKAYIRNIMLPQEVLRYVELRVVSEPYNLADCRRRARERYNLLLAASPMNREIWLKPTPSRPCCWLRG